MLSTVMHDKHYIINGENYELLSKYPYELKDYAINIINTSVNDGTIKYNGVDIGTIAKIADNNTTVLGRMFKAGMQKVVWDICEVPVGNFLFWRRPYYGKFMTLFTFDEKPEIPVPLNKFSITVSTLSFKLCAVAILLAFSFFATSLKKS